MTSVVPTVAPNAAPNAVPHADAARPSPAASAAQSRAEVVEVAASAVAPLGDRALAALVDTVALGGAFAVIGNWAAALWGGATSSGFEMTGTPPP